VYTDTEPEHISGFWETISLQHIITIHIDYKYGFYSIYNQWLYSLVGTHMSWSGELCPRTVLDSTLFPYSQRVIQMIPIEVQITTIHILIIRSHSSAVFISINKMCLTQIPTTIPIYTSVISIFV